MREIGDSGTAAVAAGFFSASAPPAAMVAFSVAFDNASKQPRRALASPMTEQRSNSFSTSAAWPAIATIAVAINGDESIILLIFRMVYVLLVINQDSLESIAEYLIYPFTTIVRAPSK
ncbi:MAG TPA: hypothetical protein VGP06_01895 [Janthinobacterium sp.]|nr:hypothetical protein [Janthinobacterium sp.]